MYDDYSIGRFYGQCPLIDTVVYIKGKHLLGHMAKVKITNVLEYDLEGEIYEFTK